MNWQDSVLHQQIRLVEIKIADRLEEIARMLRTDADSRENQPVLSIEALKAELDQHKQTILQLA